MPITSNDVLSLIQARPVTIPDGFTDAAIIGSYIAEAKEILLAYCTALPDDSTAVPDALLYPWVAIATASMQADSVAQTGTVSAIKEGDTSINYASRQPTKAALLDSVGANNVRIMNRYRTLF